MILIIGVIFICFICEELIIKAVNHCVLYYLCFTFVPILPQKGRDVSHCWDSGFVLLALPLSDTYPLPRNSPRCPKIWHICAEADILTSHCLNFFLMRGSFQVKYSTILLFHLGFLHLFQTNVSLCTWADPASWVLPEPRQARIHIICLLMWQIFSFMWQELCSPQKELIKYTVRVLVCGLFIHEQMGNRISPFQVLICLFYPKPLKL